MNELIPKALIYLCAGMLAIAALPMPYGYYTLVRLVACGTFGYAAFVAYGRGYQVMPWLFAVVAVLFNPIIKVHFSKEIWMVVDLLSAGLLLSILRWRR